MPKKPLPATQNEENDANHITTLMIQNYDTNNKTELTCSAQFCVAWVILCGWS